MAWYWQMDITYSGTTSRAQQASPARDRDRLVRMTVGEKSPLHSLTSNSWGFYRGPDIVGDLLGMGVQLSRALSPDPSNQNGE
jgi:hypothetical protein